MSISLKTHLGRWARINSKGRKQSGTTSAVRGGIPKPSSISLPFTVRVTACTPPLRQEPTGTLEWPCTPHAVATAAWPATGKGIVSMSTPKYPPTADHVLCTDPGSELSASSVKIARNYPLTRSHRRYAAFSSNSVHVPLSLPLERWYSEDINSPSDYRAGV